MIVNPEGAAFGVPRRKKKQFSSINPWLGLVPNKMGLPDQAIEQIGQA